MNYTNIDSLRLWLRRVAHDVCPCRKNTFGIVNDKCDYIMCNIFLN